MQGAEHLVGHGPEHPSATEMRVPFVVFAQAPVIVHPAKASLDNPALGQHLKARHAIAALHNLDGKAKLLLYLFLPRFSFKARI